jgi:hypothetical protein
MKLIKTFFILLMLLFLQLNLTAQTNNHQSEEEKLIAEGYIFKGNGTFIPSFTFFNKHFMQKIKENDVSKLLPRYSLKRDTVDKIIKLTYGFYYEGKAAITLTLDKNGYIKEAVIFNAKSETDLNSKVLKAGFKRDNVTSSYSHTTTKYYVHPAGISFNYNDKMLWWSK